MTERRTIRCPGLPYPDYTELNKARDEGWEVVAASCNIEDSSVTFRLVKEVAHESQVRQ